MARLVVVSNRVPLPSERGARAGGLAVALADALQPGSLWFGWSGQRTSRNGTKPDLQQANGITYATLDLSEHEYQLFYAGYSNGALWPLLHFRLGLVNYRSEEYLGYREVNRRFAESLRPLLKPDDLIWVHDYHLIPLGQELRALGTRNRLGFFLHTPFAPPDIMQALPHADELLASMCAYDVVGFHTVRYRNAFVDCCKDMLGAVPSVGGRLTYKGCAVWPIVDPIGINPDEFARTAVVAARGAEARRLRESLPNRALAIGVDRLDYSKGLINRLDAFGRLLARYPEHRRTVSLLQIAARSREDVNDYRRLREELNRLVGDINGQYSEFDWAPIRYMTRPTRRRTLAGFYRMAQIGVVTPLRDGMNLVAKEYVAAQDPANPGVLVLSRFAGAAEDMTDALVVNPYDADEVAEAMHRALLMDLDERQARHQALRERVGETTATKFCQVFLSHLSPGERLPAPGRVARGARSPVAAIPFSGSA